MSSPGHSASCSARTAIAGNPSDGHGGAVVATEVTARAATVRVRRNDRFEVAGTDLAYDSIDELVERVAMDGCGEVQPLVPAALVVLHHHLGARIATHRIEVHTTIPRSVGLAGSSAIVIATMRALVAAHPDAPWARALDEEPTLLASLALAAERDVLGIAAGLQDRVVQAFGGTVAMEFGSAHTRTIRGLEAGTYRSVGRLPHDMFVAYRVGAPTDSGQVHAAVDGTADAVRSAMARAADAGREAADAIESGDVARLADAMNATFDERAAVMDLVPDHVEMIEVARANGAAANYTGSGGAVVVLASDGRARAALQGVGCELVEL